MNKLTITIAMLLLVGCASALPYERFKRSPEGQALEQAIDLSQVNMFQLATAEPVNLGSYMEERNLDYLLLFFGSKGCGICTEKSIKLRDEYMGRHALWAGPESDGFELIGVSTDGLEARGLVSRFALQNRFEHYRWIDPLGGEMLKWFMPAGKAVGVPFTVMLSREGILWRVTNDDKENGELDAMIERARSTVVAGGLRGDDGDGGNDDGGGDGGSGGGDGTGDTRGDGSGTDGNQDGGSDDGRGDDGDGVIPVPNGNLVATTSNRLKGTTIKACTDGAEQDLHELLGDASIRLVQVLPATCTGDCTASVAALEQAARTCEDCAGVSLLADDVACTEGAYEGGQPFMDAFSSMLDWRHKVTLDDNWNLQLADFASPLLFAFAADGTLLHADESHQTAASLASLLGSATLPEPARTFDRPVYIEGETKGFADRKVLVRPNLKDLLLCKMSI